MTTTSVSSTDLELDQYRTQTISTNAHLTTSSNPVNVNDVAEASRVVDAGVPEGGYGWIALAACGIICFWFVGT